MRCEDERELSLDIVHCSGGDIASPLSTTRDLLLLPLFI